VRGGKCGGVEAFEMRFVFGIRFGVASGKFRDLGESLRAVLPHEQMTAVGKRREERRVFRVDDVAVAGEIEFAHDFFLHEAGKIGGSGNAVAGPDFLGDGASADQLAGFEDEDFLAGFGEIGGGDESVMASADDEDVVRVGHCIS
jgi:hypothetical protein